MGSPSRESDASPGTDEHERGPAFRLKTLGAAVLLRATPGQEPVEILGPGKPLALLVYLASSPARSASRERLVDLLWSNLDLERARHGLRQALWYVRKRMGSGAIESRRQDVELRAPVDSDRDRFLAAVEAGDVESAVDLYRGGFLPMFASPGGADFEAWVDREGYRLRRLFQDATESAAWRQVERGAPEKAKELARRARDIHPLSQRSWRLLLEVLLAANEPTTARIEARILERQLEEEERSTDPATEEILATIQESGRGGAVRRPDSHIEPELIAREREFARILAAWRNASGGRGCHIHIVGPAGQGKSRLLGEVGDRLKTSGAHLAAVRAAPGRRELPYALISAIAIELAKLPGAEGLSSGACSALVALHPSLSERFVAPPDPARGGEALRHRDAALAELTRAVTAQGPVALLVDDTHWADPRSLDLLRSLCDRVAQHQMLLVTSARPVNEGDMRGPTTETLALRPLSTGDVAALLSSLGSLPEVKWATTFPERLSRSTAGSPLLIVETLRFALERGWLSLEVGEWVCPDRARLEAELSRGSALRRRVSDLQGRERRLLLHLAAFGAPIEIEILAGAVQRRRKEVLRKLQEMEVRGLVTAQGDSWALSHDEIGAAVVESEDAGNLRRAHRSLGRSLARTARDLSGEPAMDRLRRSARHLFEAGEGPILGHVYDRWVRAVRRSGDHRSLQALAEEALAGTSDPLAIRKLNRSLPITTRFGISTPGAQRLILTIGILGMVVWTLVQMAPSEPPTPDVALLILRPGPGGQVAGYEVPIRREGWNERKAVDVSAEARPIPALNDLPVHGGNLIPAPGGQSWAFAGDVEEGWAPDLFLVAADGEQERVSRVPGEDVPLSYSPDGRSLLFMTGRWNPHYWHDLAILDLETDRIRPLVRSDDAHGSAHWSPDGTRVVFDRHRTGAELRVPAPPEDDHRKLCWITVDGDRERCPELPFQRVQPIGWLDTESVIARAGDRGGTSDLYRIHLETGEARILHRRVAGATLSPDRAWLALRREESAGVPAGWYVQPSDRPDLARPLVGMHPSPEWPVRWGRITPPDDYLDRIRIKGPDSVTVGVPMRFRARGEDPRGRSVPLHVLSWSTDDTTIAIFDEGTDILRARRSGPVRIQVSAGGWRDTSTPVTVVPPARTGLWTEDWRRGLESRWVPFGNPRPAVTEWLDEGRAFWNRGDGFYGSGAYSLQEFQREHALGIEVQVSVPRTAPRAQRINIALHAWSDPESATAWDHRTGALVGGVERCGFVYPAGDGAHHLHQGRVGGQEVELDPSVASGEPFTVRLQLFPDGTCGVAIDSVPLFRGDLRTMHASPNRIVLAGESLNTRVLVGEVEVWEGIPGDLDWSSLRWDPQSGNWQGVSAPSASQ